MRSIWKGSLVFGLVNVPIAVYTATEDHDIKFHQVHGDDGGRIRYQRKCEICDKTVGFGDIVKAYEADDGRTAIITDDDLKSLPTSSEREIDLLSFVPADQIDPILFDQTYLLEPTSKSPKAYVLLRETLEATDRIAIVHFALRQKTRLAALRVRGDEMVVQTLLWPDEVRQAEFESLSKPITITDAEKQMAALLVDSYSDDFHPEQHQDTYRIELQQLIDAKLDDHQAFPDAPERPGGDAEVLDLLAALQRSVQRHKDEGTSGGSETADEPAAGGSKASTKKRGAGPATAPSEISRIAGADVSGASVSAARRSRTRKPADTADDATGSGDASESTTKSRTVRSRASAKSADGSTGAASAPHAGGDSKTADGGQAAAGHSGAAKKPSATARKTKSA